MAFLADFRAFDLGGRLEKAQAEDVLGAIRSEFSGAAFRQRDRSVWQLPRLSLDFPSIQVDSQDLTATHPNLSAHGIVEARRDLFLDGSGFLLASYRYDLGGASLSEVLDFRSILYEVFPWPEVQSSPHEDDIRCVAAAISEYCQPFLQLRPARLKPVSTRFLLGFPLDLDDDDAVAKALRDFAAYQGHKYPRDPRITEPASERITRWPNLILASWADVDCIALLGSSANADAVVETTELAHVGAIHAYQWLDILDHYEYSLLTGTTLTESDLRELEGEIVDTLNIEQKVSQALLGVDRAELIYKEAFRRHLLDDLYTRFGVDTLQQAVVRRLEGMSRRHDALVGVMGRVYQEASRQQANRLQFLFAGAVAAGLTSLIPAFVSLHQSSSSALFWTLVTALSTVIGWGLLIFVGQKLSKIKLQFFSAQELRAKRVKQRK